MPAATGRRGFALLVGLSLAALAAAEPYRVGDALGISQGLDQYGKEMEVRAGEVRAVIFDDPTQVGSAEPPKDPKWFEEHRAVLMVDLSSYAGFKRRIARGRMQSRPFRMLVVEDATVAGRFPRQKDKFTVVRLDDHGAITEILYAAPGNELQSLFALVPR